MFLNSCATFYNNILLCDNIKIDVIPTNAEESPKQENSDCLIWGSFDCAQDDICSYYIEFRLKKGADNRSLKNSGFN